jgi:hypothetical protein
MKRFLVAAIAALVASTGTSASAVAPVKVLGTPKNEFYVAKAAGWLAYSQTPTTDVARATLFAKPDVGSAFRINKRGTFAGHPSIDLGNATLGNVLVFSQSNTARGQDDIKLFDLDARTVSSPPTEINTTKSERAPFISGDFLMFGRGPVDAFLKKLILFDLTDGTSTVLDEAYYIYPGGIAGDWLSWERCERTCQIYRYQISTGVRSKVAKPSADAIPYSPQVDADGTVFYLNSGPHCGQNVRFYRDTIGDPLVMRYRFPDRIDGWLGDVEPTVGGPEVYFSRQACRTVNGDIYRIAG